MLPGEAELVSEWTGLSGRAKSVKCFERSNGLDTALYKNYLYLLYLSTDQWKRKTASQCNCTETDRSHHFQDNYSNWELTDHTWSRKLWHVSTRYSNIYRSRSYSEKHVFSMWALIYGSKNITYLIILDKICWPIKWIHLQIQSALDDYKGKTQQKRPSVTDQLAWRNTYMYMWSWASLIK